MFPPVKNKNGLAEIHPETRTTLLREERRGNDVTVPAPIIIASVVNVPIMPETGPGEL